MPKTQEAVHKYNLPGRIGASLWVGAQPIPSTTILTPGTSEVGIVGYRHREIVTDLGTTRRSFRVEINVYPLEDGQVIRLKGGKK